MDEETRAILLDLAKVVKDQQQQMDIIAAKQTILENATDWARANADIVFNALATMGMDGRDALVASLDRYLAAHDLRQGIRDALLAQRAAFQALPSKNPDAR